MADTKISALTAATTPLAGTEVLPIVQGGTTKKVPVSSLTAGRDVDMAKAKPTDNVVMAAGKGIDFTANGGDVLTQYDEGTFTPTIVGSTTAGTATYGRQTGCYTRIGRLVTFSIDLDWSGGTGTGDLRINGLPFTSASGHNTGVGSSYTNITLSALNIPQPWIAGSSSVILQYQVPAGGGAVTAVAYVSTGAVMLFGSYNV